MKRILIVEDNTNNRQLIALVLEFHGYETIQAMNGQQAILAAKSRHPDLILMDISMPVLNGLDATRKIKQDSTVAHIPVVAMSVYDTEQDRQAVQDAGCLELLVKPIDISKLKSCIETTIAQYGKPAALNAPQSIQPQQLPNR
ncbi:MAG: response regulator [Ardenticatenales bacterium]|nr:response regulator [Ardenticatenales bacterium]